MTDRLPEPPSPRTYFEPIGPEGAVARKNIRLAIALFVIALVFAAGAIAVSFIYLQFD
jgi:hypothetical protein